FYDGSPMIYDINLQSSQGQNIVSGFSSQSTLLGAELTGDHLFYYTPLVLNVNNNLPAKIYAPAVYSPGSSTSHLDEHTYNGGPNSLMTPAISKFERVLDPGPIV